MMMTNLILHLLQWKLKLNQKFLKTVQLPLTKDYNKLISIKKKNLQCILNSQNFLKSKRKSYEKIVNDILE